jgi:hypothetical protein
MGGNDQIGNRDLAIILVDMNMEFKGDSTISGDDLWIHGKH